MLKNLTKMIARRPVSMVAKAPRSNKLSTAAAEPRQPVIIREDSTMVCHPKSDQENDMSAMTHTL